MASGGVHIGKDLISTCSQLFNATSDSYTGQGLENTQNLPHARFMNDFSKDLKIGNKDLSAILKRRENIRNWKCQGNGFVLFCFFAILNMEVRGGITENVIFELILEEGK